MDWTNSHAFWWLGVLAIPIIIHLLSKKRQELIRIGSTRFINPSETMSSKSIHFTQWLLFLIRSLMIICLVMIVAEPHIKSHKTQKQVYVEDVIATISAEGTTENQKWMDYDDKIIFSINGNHNPPGEFINYWTFIHFLNQQNNEAVVYADNGLPKFSGSAELLNPDIEWVVVPRKEKITLRDTVYGDNGGIPIIYTISDETLNYETEDPTPSNNIDTTFIKVLTSQQSLSLRKHFDLLIQAIDQQLPWKISTAEVSDPDWIVLIDTMAFGRGANHIAYHPSDEMLEFRKVSHQHFQLTGQLDLKSLTLSDFPDLWTAMISSEHVRLKDFDKRKINGLPVYTDDELPIKTSLASGSKADLPLWITFFILIAIERILSTKNQA